MSAAALHFEALAKLTSQQAAEVCAQAKAGGFELPACQSMGAAEFLNHLVSTQQLDQAVKFLSFALPARESVWWACMCARADKDLPLAPPFEDALRAAEDWVRQPNEENRRLAMTRAQATNFQSPAVWAAVAAFWSGGSMAPENLPAVPPAPHLLGTAVAGAVTLAAVQTEPQSADHKRARFLESAKDIANGGSGRITLSKA